MTAKQLCSPILPLNYDTPDGLFVTGMSGPNFWIMHSSLGYFAVQLNDANGRPTFSFYHLGKRPVAMGLWLGPVLLRLGDPVEDCMRKKCGIVIGRGSCLYLKLNNQAGFSKQIRINGYHYEDRLPRSLFYKQWQLEATIAGQSTTVFESALEPRSIYPYEAGTPLIIKAVGNG